MLLTVVHQKIIHAWVKDNTSKRTHFMLAMLCYAIQLPSCVLVGFYEKIRPSKIGPQGYFLYHEGELQRVVHIYWSPSMQHLPARAPWRA